MNPNHKPLTERERNVANVAVDLLMKGNPCTRIAKYAIEQGLTADQLSTLCAKFRSMGLVSLGEETNIARIYLERGMDDSAQAAGKRLKHALKNS